MGLFEDVKELLGKIVEGYAIDLDFELVKAIVENATVIDDRLDDYKLLKSGSLFIITTYYSNTLPLYVAFYEDYATAKRDYEDLVKTFLGKKFRNPKTNNF